MTRAIARDPIYRRRRFPAEVIEYRAAMQELAAQYPRYGYRRIQVFLGHRSRQLQKL